MTTAPDNQSGNLVFAGRFDGTVKIGFDFFRCGNVQHKTVQPQIMAQRRRISATGQNQLAGRSRPTGETGRKTTVQT